MPIVSIKIATGRTVEQKRQLVQAITDTVVAVLDVKPEWVTVLMKLIEGIGRQVMNFILISLTKAMVKYEQNRN